MLLQLVMRETAVAPLMPRCQTCVIRWDLYVSRSPRLCPSSLFSALPYPLEKKKNVVNGSSLPLTELTWADLTGLPVSFVWQSSMKRAQKLWGRKKKGKERRWGWASKVLNPNTIKACLSKTWLSFIPQLSSDPLLCCLLLQSLSAARLPCVFLIYPLLYKPPATPHKAPFLWSCPVLGPLCHGKPLFLLLPIINARAWSQMERVGLSKQSRQLDPFVGVWKGQKYAL